MNLDDLVDSIFDLGEDGRYIKHVTYRDDVKLEEGYPLYQMVFDIFGETMMSYGRVMCFMEKEDVDLDSVKESIMNLLLEDDVLELRVVEETTGKEFILFQEVG